MYAAVRNSKAENKENFTRQGSLRRVLPSEHNKDNVFGRQHEDLNKSYKKFYQEYAILAEFKMLLTENLQGVYVIPSRENSLLWFGVIYVRSGLYEDGIFRFNIELPENFPEGDRPKVFFQSDLYHPVIDEKTNELNLNDAFPVWNKSEQHIWQVLKYIHWIFYNFKSSTAHGINKDAIDLYKSDETAYKEKVLGLVKKSQQQIFDAPPTDDKHYITFEAYDAAKHDSVKTAMLNQQIEEKPKVIGHSWVSAGSFKPLSRAPSPVSESE